MSPDAAPTIISDPSAGSFHPELVKGSGPRLATETQALLRGRLRAAGTVLTGTWLLALFRTLLVPGVGVAPGQLLGLVLAGRLTALIHLKPVFSLRQLRSLELGLIFSSAITGGFLQFSDLARLGDAGKVELLTAHLGQSAVLYIWLMLLYGMFIPNTWQRAARVVGAIALVPVGVRLALRLHNPALSELFSADQVSFNVLVLVVSGVSAIYGTHVINSLRQEAHQARKLGQYHLVARIGKGGMGEVWRASHKMLARPAAVKLIRPEMLGGQDSSEDATTLRRFEREARATAGLKSPHSIVIYDFGITDEGIFYYVMELLEGLDLESFVSRFGPVSPARAIHILAQSCDSLGDAHAAGLIHRDVKPANLYLCRLGLVSDFVKVLDFGLVKVQDEKELDETRLTKVGMTTGTPSYMSPQQVLGEAVDQRSDIYSLGCVAYWLVTGGTVFEGNSSVGVVIDHVKTTPEPPSTRADQDIPADLEGVILDCLKKEPDERPATALELKERLMACQDSSGWNQETAADWWARHMGESGAAP